MNRFLSFIIIFLFLFLSSCSDDENQIAIDFFMGQMDRDIFYMIQCEHYWQPIYLMLGEWKKAFMTMTFCCKSTEKPTSSFRPTGSR